MLFRSSRAYYLSGLERGSYQEWVAKGDFEQTKSAQKAVLNEFDAPLSQTEKRGREMKMEQVHALIKEFEEIQKELLKRGAKTFEELFPNMKKGESAPACHKNWKASVPPFSISFAFKVADLTVQKRDGYLQL